MIDPSNFRSTLERLVFELGAAHDREVAALQAEVVQVRGDGPELCITPIPALVHASDTFTPRSSTTPREVLGDLTGTPREGLDDRNVALHQGTRGLLTTPRRQQSMNHSSSQPPQPKPQPAQALLDLPCWESGDNPVAAEEAVEGVREPSNVGNVESFKSSSSSNGTVTEETLDTILADLPSEFMRSLRAHFDRLDIYGEDKITIHRFLDMVNTFSEEPLDAEALVPALHRLHEARDDTSHLPSPLERLKGSIGRHLFSPDKFLYFEDFAYLMAYGDLVPVEKMEHKKSVSHDVAKKFRSAMQIFDDHQSQLSKAAEHMRSRHNRLVFFLDVVPAPVILLNSLVLGLRADIETESSFWRVADFVFLAFYISEAAVKCWLFKCRLYWCGPGASWNIFDFACIVVSVTDMFLEYGIPAITGSETDAQVGELMLMKMLRLAKLGRLLKVLPHAAFDELKAMIFGVVSGVRVILWAIVLLFFCVFFLGAVMNNLVGDNRKEFRTVPASMFTVFRCFTDGCAAYDGTPLTEHLRIEYGALFIIGYTLAFMFVTVGVFNLIMATFIENVVSTSQSRKQEELGEKTDSTRSSLEHIFLKLITSDRVHIASCLSVRLIPRRLKKEVKKEMKSSVPHAFLMLPENLAISKPVFSEWLLDKEFIKVLQDADIDTSNTTDLFDVLDADMSQELTLKELIDGLMRLRGPITKSDMIGVRMQVQLITQIVQNMNSAGLPVEVSKEELDELESLEGDPRDPLSPHTLHMQLRSYTKDLNNQL